MREVTEAVLRLLADGRRGALATVVATVGSTPQRPGARLLLQADGSYVGTVGGGAIEWEVQKTLCAVRDSGSATLCKHDLGRDLAMCCGGQMEIFVEPVCASPRLWLLGAGHVAQATAALAGTVGFDVHCVDERDELNCPERFGQCTRLIVDPAAILRRREFTRVDWILILTHDHELDGECLRLALQTGARYVGLVGSRRKVYRLVHKAQPLLSEPMLQKLYAPVGLELGAESPSEIAVSIVSELLSVRNGTTATPMRQSVSLSPLRCNTFQTDTQSARHSG